MNSREMTKAVRDVFTVEYDADDRMSVVAGSRVGDIVEFEFGLKKYVDGNPRYAYETNGKIRGMVVRRHWVTDKVLPVSTEEDGAANKWLETVVCYAGHMFSLKESFWGPTRTVLSFGHSEFLFDIFGTYDVSDLKSVRTVDDDAIIMAPTP